MNCNNARKCTRETTVELGKYYYSIEDHSTYGMCCLYFSVKLPLAIKVKGRRKGHNLTTIGLPAKRSKNSSKPQPFILMHTYVKEEGSYYALYFMYYK